jgi:hypothetical protein
MLKMYFCFVLLMDKNIIKIMRICKENFANNYFHANNKNGCGKMLESFLVMMRFYRYKYKLEKIL